MKISLNIESGAGSFNIIYDFFSENRFKKALLLVDSNLEENSKYLRNCILKFKKKFNILKINYSYKFEPSYDYLNFIIRNIKKDKKYNAIDIIVAIGGGSTIDTGKGIAILLKNPGNSRKYMGFPKKLMQPIPLIAIPSTTGTGSEVAYNASFIDEKNKKKLGINFEKNYPILSILDQLIIKSMPKNVLKSSGSDLIVHTVESFMSTKKNKQTETLSLNAFKLIDMSFEKSIKYNYKTEDLSNLQWACVWSMLALSNSSGGPSSAFSYLLGTHFKIPHGIAGGFFLKKIINYNIDNNFDFSLLFTNHKFKNKNYIRNYFNNLFNLCDIPDNIEEFGVIKKRDFNKFSNFYDNVKSVFSFNPIKITKKNFLNLIFN